MDKSRPPSRSDTQSIQSKVSHSDTIVIDNGCNKGTISRQELGAAHALFEAAIKNDRKQIRTIMLKSKLGSIYVFDLNSLQSYIGTKKLFSFGIR